jgi:hypothetical protein
MRLCNIVDLQQAAGRSPRPSNHHRTRPTQWSDVPKKKARYGDIAGYSYLVAWDWAIPNNPSVDLSFQFSRFRH